MTKKQQKDTTPQPSRSTYQRIKDTVIGLHQKTWVRFIIMWFISYAILLGFFFRTILGNFAYIEIFSREVIFPLALHGCTALCIALVLFWLPWLRTFAGKLASTVVLTLLMVDYDANLQEIADVIRAFVPGLSKSDPLAYVSIIYILMLAGLSLAAGLGTEYLLRRWKRIRHRDLELGLVVLAVYMLLTPCYGFVRILPTLVRESRVQAPELTKAADAQPATDKPDIYYIVLDRYTNGNVLQQQFDYDNSSFTGFLKDSNFYVNDQAYSNYPYTAMSVSSTLNARYTKEFIAPFKDSEVQSRTLYHNLIWQSSVVKALKNEGYKYYSIGSWYGATYKAPLADVDRWEHMLTVFGQQKRLRGIEAIEFAKSPFYRLAQMSTTWWPLGIAEKDHVTDIREQISMLDQTTQEEQGGRFIFAHILVPHDPYVFNGDGSLSAFPERNSNGKPIKEKYLGQIQFINTQMQALVAKIQKRSNGKAVVVFNSDEGTYPQVMNDSFMKPTSAVDVFENGVIKEEDMRTWSKDWLQMKFGILQAVHIPQATQDDLAHLNSANLFRIILNRYAGYNLPYLPECHFGVTSGTQNEYKYADITGKFTDSPDQSCQDLQTVQQ